MKNLCLTFILLLFVTDFVSAQNNSLLTKSIQKLADYHNNFPKEQVYLHTDKPYYSIGDEIWFKAYLTIGNYNSLSSLSKILYVELINPNNEVAISVRLPIVSGITYGNIFLSDSLSEGNYRIRAYSNWMRNFDEGYFFDKTIPIGNALNDNVLAKSTFSVLDNGSQKTLQSNITFTDWHEKPLNNTKVDYAVLSDKKNIHQGKETTDANGSISVNFKEPKGGFSNSLFITTEINTDNRKSIKQIPIRNTSESYSAQFYPENGKNLIAGIINKIVFKVTQNSGEGIGVEGIIEDNEGKKITDFEPNFAGIGSFSFYPINGQSYKAVITLPNGTTQEFNLPETVPQGYSINANTWSSDQIYIQVVASPGLVKNQTINLILQKKGEVFYAAKIKIKDEQITIRVPKKNLPPGLIELNLLTDEMQSLANKYIYVSNELYELPLEVTTDKEQYSTRSHVSVKLKTGIEEDSLRVATLSVSVTDLNKIPVDTLIGNTITSYLNLTAETPDYVQSPKHYFKSSDLSTKSQLDNLVLTFGKDSVWQEIKKPEPKKPKFQPEQDLRISGTITRPNGKPVPFAHVLVLVSDKGSILDTVADEYGRFNFDRLLFYENTKFVVQARDEKGKKNVEIVLDEVPRQQVSKNKNAPDISLDTNQSMDVYLKNTQKRFEELIKAGKMDNSILLDNVNITVEKKNPAEHSSNLNGPGNADQVLSAEDLNTCSNLRICLQGRLMGVIFKNGIPYSTRSQNIPMQIIVDGMYLSEDALSSISPMDVGSIEVLRRPGSLGIYGSLGAGGVIIITTKQGDGSYSNLHTPGIVTYSPQGIYEVKTFESPDYSNPEVNKNEQDLRSTIYWNPNIVTDEKGEVKFEFYSADRTGHYRIVIEGIDLNGRIGRSETYIDIVQ